ncbi:MAG: ATP-dependent Clp protease adapter protein ClpS [Alphaproteobacteria bacterium ADurb.Bin438]|nr:MAG: ATP-dependent Clp protease adapter protein ClpS [Alphaproteobacteria bacterium ADurb.Bin438]
MAKQTSKINSSGTKLEDKVKKPQMYKVVMLNDDFTPMDFVVDVVCKVFKKTVIEATEIMLNIHKKGSGICGVYTYEIAETKVMEVIDLARKKGHPLQCQIEQA